MLRLIAQLAMIASLTSCCGYSNDGSVVIQEARPGEKIVITLPDGRKVEVEPRGGEWVDIDPITGQVETKTIDEVISGRGYKDAKTAVKNSGCITLHGGTGN